MKEALDHALDQALREEVGEERPPDRTFQITAAIQAARRSPRRGHGGIRRPMLIGMLSGAAAAAAVLLVHGALTTQPSPAVPELRVQVAKGSVNWQQQDARDSAPTREAGQSFWITPKRGDQLSGHPTQETKLDIPPFGALKLSRATQLKVVDMDWKEFGMGFGTGSITIAVVAGSFSWFTDGDVQRGGSGETSTLALRHVAKDAPQSGSAREQELLKKLQETQRQLAEAQRSTKRQPIGKRPDRSAPGSEAKQVFEPIGNDPMVAKVLREMGWQDVASTTLEATRLNTRMMQLLAEGKDVPRELKADMWRLEGSLQKHGAVVEKLGKLEGATFETRVRHPAIGANWMAATLVSAKLPLDEDQRQRLGDLTSRFLEQDRLRRDAMRSDATKLERFFGELTSEEAFYNEALTILDKKQAALLTPGKEFRGRVNSTAIGPYSASWQEWTQVNVFDNTDDFVRRMSGGWSKALGIEGDARKTVQQLMREWIQAYPQEMLKEPMTPLDRRYMKVERVRLSAQLQLRFYRRLESTLPLTAVQRQFLRNATTIIVPFLKK